MGEEFLLGLLLAHREGKKAKLAASVSVETGKGWILGLDTGMRLPMQRAV